MGKVQRRMLHSSAHPEIVHYPLNESMQAFSVQVQLVRQAVVLGT